MRLFDNAVSTSVVDYDQRHDVQYGYTCRGSDYTATTKIRRKVSKMIISRQNISLRRERTVRLRMYYFVRE